MYDEEPLLESYAQHIDGSSCAESVAFPHNAHDQQLTGNLAFLNILEKDKRHWNNRA